MGVFSFLDSKNSEPFLYLFIYLFFFFNFIYSLLYQDNLCQLQQSGKLSRDEIHLKTCRMGFCKQRLYHHQNSLLEISVDYIQIYSQSPKGQGLTRSKRLKETEEGKVQVYSTEIVSSFWTVHSQKEENHKRKTNVRLWKKKKKAVEINHVWCYICKYFFVIVTISFPVLHCSTCKRRWVCFLWWLTELSPGLC